MSDDQQTLFVGLGSPHGDDQIGWLIADRMTREFDGAAEIFIRKAAVPLDLLDWLEGIDCLHVCDASERAAEALECWDLSPLSFFEERPNRIVTFRSANDAHFSGAPKSSHSKSKLLPALARLRCSGSHDFGLAAVIDLAQRLNRLPPRIVIWAVNGRRFETGQPMSDELLLALPQMTNTILEELNHARNVPRAVADESG